MTSKNILTKYIKNSLSQIGGVICNTRFLLLWALLLSSSNLSAKESMFDESMSGKGRVEVTSDEKGKGLEHKRILKEQKELHELKREVEGKEKQALTPAQKELQKIFGTLDKETQRLLQTHVDSLSDTEKSRLFLLVINKVRKQHNLKSLIYNNGLQSISDEGMNAIEFSQTIAHDVLGNDKWNYSINRSQEYVKFFLRQQIIVGVREQITVGHTVAEELRTLFSSKRHYTGIINERYSSFSASYGAVGDKNVMLLILSSHDGIVD